MTVYHHAPDIIAVGVEREEPLEVIKAALTAAIDEFGTGTPGGRYRVFADSFYINRVSTPDKGAAVIAAATMQKHTTAHYWPHVPKAHGILDRHRGAAA